MSGRRVVAIDGPAGSGKTTVSRGVSAALGLPVLDTGAMYRAVTLAAIEGGIPLDDADAVAAAAERSEIDLDAGVTRLDGRDVSAEIRTPEVTAAVSVVAAHPAVRSVLVARQRAWARSHGGAVVEGRDIGSVVFPDAGLKIYLTAGDEERARRRQRDEAAVSRVVDVGEVRAAITPARRPRLGTACVAAHGHARCSGDRHDRSGGRRGGRGDRRQVPCCGRGRRGARSDRADRRQGGRRVIFYRVVAFFVTGIPKLVWRVRIEGRENLPADGAYVIAPSHRSMMDIPFVAGITKRRVRFMGKAPLFRIPVVGSAFRALGSFPVERDGNDRKPLRDSLEILAGGDSLVVYPEGTRQNGPVIQPLQPGAAYLAVKARVPIVPVGIAGAEQIFRSRRGRLPGMGKVVVVVGEPIPTPDRSGSVVKREVVDRVSGVLSKELQGVFDHANHLRDTPVPRSCVTYSR